MTRSSRDLSLAPRVVARASRGAARTAPVPDTASDRPRERLAALGPAALADAELIALLLRGGSAGRSALALGASSLEAAGGLAGLAVVDVAELARVPGLGPATAASMVAAIELGRRTAARRLEPGALLRGPEDVHHHFAPALRDCACERFLVLLLDGRHRVIGESLVSQGTLTASLVHPREVFAPAIRRAAAAIVLVHNHPSGDPTPSSEDRNVTERLRGAGELLGIRVVDHVIVSASGFYSFEQGGGPEPL